MLIPIKGHSTHVGKRASAEASRLEAANVTSDAMLATMHTMHHPPHPSSAYVVPNGTGGGYWIKDASRGASGPDARPAPSKPFVARSSYHHEVCAPRVRAGVVPRARPRALVGAAAFERRRPARGSTTSRGTTATSASRVRTL